MTRSAASPFLVLPKTMGRCGSTWFCDMLDSHPAITCLGEVFNPGLAGQFEPILTASRGGRDLDALFGAIATRNPVSRLVGFKTFREQVGDDALRRGLAHVERLILIERRNLTAALASELHAKATSLWHAERPEQADASRRAPPITIDIDSGRNRLRNAQRTGEVIMAMAADVGLQVIELSYEDLVEATQPTMDRVFAELGVVTHEVRSSYAKLHDDSSFVSNVEEVNDALGEDFGRL